MGAAMAPQASFAADCTSLTCAFDGTSTRDARGSRGLVGLGVRGRQHRHRSHAAHTYAAAGTYTARSP